MPDWIAVVILGIIEGITEFLPISSTGHLILAEQLLHFTDERAKLFAIVIQSGAILAVVIEYRARFIGALTGMDVASECVHGAGYGYLNGALTAAGFFDPKTNKGLWLAGDYVRKYPYLRIPSANDGLVAQGATSIELARFYTLLYDGKLVDAASSLEMLELLKKAVAVPEVFIDRAANINFKVSHTKVGLGPLKPDNGGHSVYSEASIVEHASGRKFVVVWQNLIYGEDGFDPLGAVVARTLDGFIAKQATQPSK